MHWVLFDRIINYRGLTILVLLYMLSGVEQLRKWMWVVGPRCLTVGLVVEELGTEGKNGPCGKGLELETSV